jgi:hypothetical protein
MELERRPRVGSRGLGCLGRYVAGGVGWVSDPAACTVRFRDPSGHRVEVDTVEDGVAILA